MKLCLRSWACTLCWLCCFTTSLNHACLFKKLGMLNIVIVYLNKITYTTIYNIHVPMTYRAKVWFPQGRWHIQGKGPVDLLFAPYFHFKRSVGMCCICALGTCFQWHQIPKAKWLLSKPMESYFGVAEFTTQVLTNSQQFPMAPNSKG